MVKERQPQGLTNLPSARSEEPHSGRRGSDRDNSRGERGAAHLDRTAEISRSRLFPSEDGCRSLHEDIKKKRLPPRQTPLEEVEGSRAAPSRYRPLFESHSSGKGYETQRGELRTSSVGQLVRAAKERYGSVVDLFNAMGKDKNDMVSLDEFSSFMEQRRLDAKFSVMDQRLLFEKFDPSFSNRLRVGDVIDYCNSAREAKHELGYRDSGDLKSHVANLLEKRRMQNKLTPGATETLKQLRSALRNLDPQSTGFITLEKMKWALGSDYLALEMDPAEASRAIEEIVAVGKARRGVVKPADDNNLVSYDAFVTYLGLCNSDPNYHPFYDARAGQISAQQHKLIQLDEALRSPAVAVRLKELSDKYIQGRIGPGAPPPDPLSSRQPSSTPAQQEGAHFSSLPDIPKLHHQLAPGDQPPTSPAVGKETGAPSASRRGVGMSPKDKLLSSSNDMSDRTMQMTQSLDASILRHAMMREEAEVRKSVHQRGTWDGLEATDRHSAMYADSTERFQTTTSDYFPPLKYAPSEPVTRDRLGDSELAFLKRAELTRQRAARYKANTDVTKNRLEYERFLSEVRDIQREKQKGGDMLKYEKTVLLLDMNRFKKREVENMQRKANPPLYGRMWGGDFGGSHKEHDSRSFETTYLVDFSSSAGAESKRL